MDARFGIRYPDFYECVFWNFRFGSIYSHVWGKSCMFVMDIFFFSLSANISYKTVILEGGLQPIFSKHILKLLNAKKIREKFLA